MQTYVVALVLASITSAFSARAAGHGSDVATRLLRGSAWALAIASLALVFPVTHGQMARMEWLPGMEPAGLSLAWPTLLVPIAAHWALAASLASREDWLPPPRYADNGPPLALLTCALTVAALALDHLIVRVVCLDLISLCVVASLCLSKPSLSPASFIRRYLVFRLGDLAFILFGLLLARHSASMSIPTMLAGAATITGAARRAALAAAVLAGAVKLGLPPFDAWLEDSVASPAPTRAITGATGLPVLAAYLLYKLRPVFVAWHATPILILLAIAAATCAQLRSRGRNQPSAMRWLGLHGALGLALCVTDWMPLYLVSFVPLRATVLLLPGLASLRRSAPLGDKCATGPSPGCRVRLIVQTASWLEDNVLIAGVRVVGDACRGLGSGAAQVESGLSRLIVRGSHTACREFSSALSRAHHGGLRGYVLWAAMAAIAMLTVVLA